MKIRVRLILLGLLLLAVQPAWAICGIDEVCIVISPKSTAQDIAATIKDSWDLPDFSCSADITPEGVQVTAESNDGTRVMQFVVPVSGTALGHSMRLRFAVPLSRLPEPFDIFLDFDEQGEVQLPNGSSQFADITFKISTLNLTDGSGSVVPGMEDAGMLALIVGLIGGGLGILLVARKGH